MYVTTASLSFVHLIQISFYLALVPLEVHVCNVHFYHTVLHYFRVLFISVLKTLLK